MNVKAFGVACLLLLCLIVPTAAISLEEDSTGAITFEATSSHAEITENRKVRLDFQQLNNNAVTTADETFEVQVHDESIQSLWIESEDGISFYTDGNPNNKITEQTPLWLDTGDSETVGVAIDTHTEKTGTKTFTIHVAYDDEEKENEDDDDNDKEKDDTPHKGGKVESVEELPAAVDITATTLYTGKEPNLGGNRQNTTVETGQSLFVDVTFTNTANTTYVFPGRLVIGGLVFDTQTIELGAGESKTVTFRAVRETTGSYEVNINDHAVGSVTVVNPDELAPSESRDLINPISAAAAPPAIGLSLMIVFSRDKKRTLIGLLKQIRKTIYNALETRR